MMKRRFLFFFIFFLLCVQTWGETTLYPAKECPLYNNLKHTQNRGNVRLDMTRTYTMLRHHKGQYLLKVPGATPPQRWVDDDCLTLHPLRGTPLYGQAKQPQKPENTLQQRSQSSTAQPLLLALSWQNAFCETHRHKKECRRLPLAGGKADNRFTLHGLWPQPRDKVYCNVPHKLVVLDKRGQWSRLPEPKLSDETRKALQEVMPTTVSYLHRHEWIKHGTCYGTDAERYFQKAIALARMFGDSRVPAFFRANVGRRVTLQQVRFAVERSFGKGTGKRIELRCRRGMITEVWLHLYGTQNDDLARMLRHARPVRSSCKSGIIDRPGYGY